MTPSSHGDIDTHGEAGETMSQERDPRVDPRPGDVLGKRGRQRTVVDVRSGIIRPGTFVTSLCSQCWRDWAKTATIIREVKKP